MTVCRTYDLALAILHEEIEHVAWFAVFLATDLVAIIAAKAGPTRLA